MKTLVANMVLALLFAALTARFTSLNLLFGFVLGYLALWLARTEPSRSAYFHKVPQALAFSAFFLKELVVSSIQVAYDVVTRTHHMRPAILGIPLDVTTDAEITLLSSLVTLTPGTLAIDVSDDRKTLFVHAMYVRDYEATKRRIKHGFERRVLRLLR
jgi:multicomponent Na+:H+ antiporter subunit E